MQQKKFQAKDGLIIEGERIVFQISGSPDKIFEYNRTGDTWQIGVEGSFDEIETKGHLHDDRYYTETEVDSLLSAQTHVKADITDFTEADYVHVSGDETIAGEKTFSGDIIIQGNLTVSGTTTTIETTNMDIEDNIIVLNKGEVGAGISEGQAGIQIDRGTETDVVMRYNESTDLWEVGLDGGAFDAIALDGHTHSMDEIDDFDESGILSDLLILNTNFQAWYQKTVTPYDWLPVGWEAADSAGISIQDGYYKLSARVPVGEDLHQYVNDDVVDKFLRSKTVYLQGLATGEGYLRLEITHDNDSTTNYDETFDSVSWVELYQKIALPSTVKRMRIIAHSTTGNSDFDNCFVALRPYRPELLVKDTMTSKQIEFFYYDSTNTPDEGVQDDAPATILKSSGISKFYFAYAVPEDILLGCDLMLMFMVVPEDASGGNVDLEVNMQCKKGVSTTQSITTQNLSRLINLTDGSYKYVGVRIPIVGYFQQDMSLNFYVQRDAGDAGDTYTGTLKIINCKVIPVFKTY